MILKDYVKQVRIIFCEMIDINFDYFRLIDWKIIKSWLQIFENGDKICDVGCGDGRITILIAKTCKNADVYGIDLNKQKILFAHRLSRAENIPIFFQIGNAEKIPFQSGIFDKIICNSALEHFQYDEIAIKEINRILKTGGKLILTVDSLLYGKVSKFKKYHRKKHKVVNYYSLLKLYDKLEKVGFKIQKYFYYLNTPITTCLFRIGSKVGFRSISLKILFPLIYFLCEIEAQLSRDYQNSGYIFAVSAEKIK